jgi:hypothetical protein
MKKPRNRSERQLRMSPIGRERSLAAGRAQRKAQENWQWLNGWASF